MKRCPRCKETKPLSNFTKDRSRLDGLSPRCKPCCCAFQKEYRAKNREAVLAERAAYYRKNRAAVLARQANWQRENPDKVRAIAQRHRARKLDAFQDGSVTAQSVRELFERFRCRCAYCGARGTLQEDHVVPVSKGGPHIIENILPACVSCNASKADTDVYEWFERTFDLPLPDYVVDAVAAVSIFRRAA